MCGSLEKPVNRKLYGLISKLKLCLRYFLCLRPRARRTKYPIAIIIIVGMTITRICCVLISFMPIEKNLLLRPLRQYLFSLKCPRAQKEKNYIRDKGNAGDDPDSRGIQLYGANFGCNVNNEQGDDYQNTL